MNDITKATRMGSWEDHAGERVCTHGVRQVGERGMSEVARKWDGAARTRRGRGRSFNVFEMTRITTRTTTILIIPAHTIYTSKRMQHVKTNWNRYAVSVCMSRDKTTEKKKRPFYLVIFHVLVLLVLCHLALVHETKTSHCCRYYMRNHLCYCCCLSRVKKTIPITNHHLVLDRDHVLDLDLFLVLCLFHGPVRDHATLKMRKQRAKKTSRPCANQDDSFRVNEQK